MGINLGYEPASLAVHLVQGADFVQVLTNKDGDWASGTVIALVFTDQRQGEVVATWPATVTGPEARWEVDKAEVATLLAAGRLLVRLTYVLGDVDLTWATGRVVLHV